jgi:hypothetical protein
MWTVTSYRLQQNAPLKLPQFEVSKSNSGLKLKSSGGPDVTKWSVNSFLRYSSNRGPFSEKHRNFLHDSRSLVDVALIDWTGRLQLLQVNGDRK